MTTMYRSPCGLWASVSPFGVELVDHNPDRWFNPARRTCFGGDYGHLKTREFIVRFRSGSDEKVNWLDINRACLEEIVGELSVPKNQTISLLEVKATDGGEL